LDLVASTGQIAGTPTASGTYNFTAHVVDGALSYDKNLSITVQLNDLNGTWQIRLTPDGQSPWEPFCADINQSSISVYSVWWPLESRNSAFFSGDIIGDRLTLGGEGINGGIPTNCTTTSITDGNTFSGSYTCTGGLAQNGTLIADRSSCNYSRAWARVATLPGPNYNLDFWISHITPSQPPVTSAFVTGPRIVDSLQLNPTGQTGLWLGDAQPAPGDTYTFTLTYADGSVQVTSDSVLQTNVGFPTIIAPSNGEIITSTTPTFEWTPPSCGCQGYYRIWVVDSANNATMWSIYPPAEATSIVYNSDGSGSPLVSGGAYEWRLIAFDQDTSGRSDNYAMAVATFQVQ